jgi:hypothetical protein
MHMTRQVEKDGIWLDCFVHERTHQVTKEAASHLKNTVTYEKSVLVLVVKTTLHLMENITRTSVTSRTECCDELSLASANLARLQCRYVLSFDICSLVFASSLPQAVYHWRCAGCNTRSEVCSACRARDPYQCERCKRFFSPSLDEFLPLETIVDASVANLTGESHGDQLCILLDLNFTLLISEWEGDKWDLRERPYAIELLACLLAYQRQGPSANLARLQCRYVLSLCMWLQRMCFSLLGLPALLWFVLSLWMSLDFLWIRLICWTDPPLRPRDGSRQANCK